MSINEQPHEQNKKKRKKNLKSPEAGVNACRFLQLPLVSSNNQVIKKRRAMISECLGPPEKVGESRSTVL